MRHLIKKSSSSCSMFHMPYFIRERGFTMIELIITVALLSVSIIGVYTAFSSVGALTSDIALRFTASYLAQEGLGIVKNIRDNNFIGASGNGWAEGLTSCTDGCQADYKTKTPSQTPANALVAYNENNFLKVNGDGLYSYDEGSATKFKRKITIEQPLGPDALKVSVEVFWEHKGKPFAFSTEEYLYNWY